jgi:chromosome segregation ATPase
MNDKKDAYIKKLKAKLDEWNAEIDKIQAKANQAEAETKIVYEKQLADLQSKRNDVDQKISELQQAGESAWEDLKQGLENSWDILKASFTKAKTEFDRGFEVGK